MISRYDVYLNNIALSFLHPALKVLNIEYQDPQIDVSTAEIATRPGAYVTRQNITSAAVTVSFELHIYSTQARRAALDSVIAWAMQGGTLEASDREDQQLHVICTDLPAMTAKAWTEPLSLTFTAHETPFWQDKTAATSDNGSIYVPGNVPPAIARAQVDAVLTATEDLTECSLTVNSNTIYLSGLSLEQGDTITISHENGILSIRSGQTSLLDKRTGADDLLAVCGEWNTFYTDGDVTAEISIRGLWL